MVTSPNGAHLDDGVISGLTGGAACGNACPPTVTGRWRDWHRTFCPACTFAARVDAERIKAEEWSKAASRSADERGMEARALRQEMERMRGTLLEAQALLPQVAQLLDGWHQDGTAWSEWDESVRQQVGALAIAVEKALGDPQGVAAQAEGKSAPGPMPKPEGARSSPAEDEVGPALLEESDDLDWRGPKEAL